MAPGDLCLVSQHIDKTVARHSTFFGNGCVGHVPFGHPTCDVFRKKAVDALATALPGVKVHNGGTLVTMEGPVFSTKAESLANKAAGGDLIGMTAATEGKLAREAEMAHCCVAMVTDYDSWSDVHDHVDVSMVIATMKKNSANAQVFMPAILSAAAAEQFASEAHSALNCAIMTKPGAIPVETYRALELFIGKYIPAPVITGSH
jgi:5'-methylthioadenosine phosphorylase